MRCNIEAVALPPLRVRRPPRHEPSPPPRIPRRNSPQNLPLLPARRPTRSLRRPRPRPPGPPLTPRLVPPPPPLGYSRDLPMDITPTNGHLRYTVELVTTWAPSRGSLRVYYPPHPKSSHRLSEHQRTHSTEIDGDTMVHATGTTRRLLPSGHQDPAPHGQVPGPPGTRLHGAK